MSKRESASGTLKTVDRAFELIELLSHHHTMSVNEMAVALEIPRASVYHLLSTLRGRRLVQKRGNGDYGLSLRLFELGSSILEDADEVVLVRPVLEEIASITHETVHYGVLDEGDVVYIDKIDSAHSLRMFSRIGRRSPSHCTGLGKALLSSLPEAEVRRIFSNPERLVRFTQSTLTTVEDLLSDLARVQERQYALDDEEHEAGIKCVAASVTDASRKPIGAISISAPAIRFGEDKLAEYSDLIRKAANDISGRLSATRIMVSGEPRFSR